MFIFDHLLNTLVYPVVRLFSVGDSLALLWLAASLMFLLAVIAIDRGLRRRQIVLRRVIRFALPMRIVLHRSSILDYKLFVVNSVIMFGLLGFFVMTAPQWQALTSYALGAVFGPPAVATVSSWGVFILTTALQILALDFGYWLAHYWFHKSPVMWEFHKVHHSAEVMTPATEWRQHPVELLAIPAVYGLTSGVTYAVVVHIFGAEAQKLGLMGQNLILVAHLATFHHLRHSHVHMPFTGLWGRIFHSPAHHQIHHSANEIHFGKNLGYLFSIWDWLFGTLHMPRRGEQLVLGIGPEGDSHTTVRQVMLEPFRNAFRLLKPSSKP
ncbi:MAG: sterol desaturase family protein [Hyphomicrobiaceae bacterium]|nr:sterol desaturase family protein [Hyphomicrobiaceae bacterium]